MFKWLRKSRDSRAQPRWKIDRFLGVYDRDASIFLGRVQDLSLSGMCVASTELPPVGQHVRLMLEILRDSGTPETFMLRCRTLWTRPWGNSGLQLIGFEFSGPSPAAVSRIQDLLREQAEKDQGRAS
jgi:hypothetical protein